MGDLRWFPFSDTGGPTQRVPFGPRETRINRPWGRAPGIAGARARTARSFRVVDFSGCDHFRREGLVQVARPVEGLSSMRVRHSMEGAASFAACRVRRWTLSLSPLVKTRPFLTVYVTPPTLSA